MSIQPANEREEESGEPNPTLSPPVAFGGSEGHHLTVGMTGSGKSYSVARRARAWLSESLDRTLVIVAKNSSYNGLVGECNGVCYEGMGLDRATSDEEIIKPNGVTLVAPGGYAGTEEWGEMLERFYSRFASFADEKPGEAALILDDVPLGGIDREGLSPYEQLLTEGNNGQVWRVVQSLRSDMRRSGVENPPSYAPDNPANYISFAPREYLRQFTAIDLFGSPRLETLGEEFELREAHRRYLCEEAGVIQRGSDGYSFGLGRSHARQPWYRFRETTTDREHAVLDYRGRPFEFELEDEL